MIDCYWCKKPTSNKKFCSLSCQGQYSNSIRTDECNKRMGSNVSKSANKRKQKSMDEYYADPKHCKQCNSMLSYHIKHNTFCNQSCGAIYSNKMKHIIKKIYQCQYCNHNSPSKHSLTNHEKHCKNNPNKVSRIKKEGKLNNILELSIKTYKKILKKLNIGCSLCGWNDEVCDIHHIIPKQKGGSNDHSNLTYICPNHHRLAHKGKIDHFISLDVQLSEYKGMVGDGSN